MSSPELSGEEIWSDDDNEPCVCLFCPTLFPSQAAFVAHSQSHGFDFKRTMMDLG
jgi:hypothetical protein